MREKKTTRGWRSLALTQNNGPHEACFRVLHADWKILLQEEILTKWFYIVTGTHSQKADRLRTTGEVKENWDGRRELCFHICSNRLIWREEWCPGATSPGSSLQILLWAPLPWCDRLQYIFSKQRDRAAHILNILWFCNGRLKHQIHSCRIRMSFSYYMHSVVAKRNVLTHGGHTGALQPNRAVQTNGDRDSHAWRFSSLILGKIRLAYPHRLSLSPSS
jgi:hypothetical protein